MRREATSPTPLNGIVNYSLTVTNKGPDTATNVQLADPAPAGITYLSANPSQGDCVVQPRPPVGALALDLRGWRERRQRELHSLLTHPDVPFGPRRDRFRLVHPVDRDGANQHRRLPPPVRAE